MEKALKQIQSVKQDGETVQNYIRDLSTWESEMKRKEAALKSEVKQELPPVRSRLRREKHLKNKKKNQKNPAKSNAWEGGDSNKACEDMDMSEVAPLSLTLDGKQSDHIKQIKNREEAQQQKERGNKFVKVERWDDAIACYNRAIQLVKDDAIYYANRGLCYLKKESLHQAEADCTEALRLDPAYVKALQRRATAREKLGSLRAASSDLAEVLKLEPHNVAAKKQLDSIKQRMGTKGRKAKSSPQQPSNPIVSSAPPKTAPIGDQPLNNDTPRPKTKAVLQTSTLIPEHLAKLTRNIQASNEGLDYWKDGVGEDILVIKPVKKPPHLRSKRALKTIPIKEIPLGRSTPIEQEPKRMIIEEVDYLAHTDAPENENKMATDHNKENIGTGNEKEKDLIMEQGLVTKDSKMEQSLVTKDSKMEQSLVTKDLKMEQGLVTKDSKMEQSLVTKDSKIEQSVTKDLKMEQNTTVGEKQEKELMNERRRELAPPASSVQFMAHWRRLAGDDAARSDYLTLLEPNTIPKVFANALESDVLSDIIKVLHQYKEGFGSRLAAYLKGLARVRRLSALVMFLSAADKELLNQLLVHCKSTENCCDGDIDELKQKFEL